MQEQHRAKEFAREAFERGVQQDRNIRAGLNFEERTENARRLRELAERDHFINSQKAQAQAEQQQQDWLQNAGSQEEARQKEEHALEAQLRDAKMRQAIREGSPELKELERRLKEAQTRKTHLVQMQEKIVVREQQKVALHLLIRINQRD